MALKYKVTDKIEVTADHGQVYKGMQGVIVDIAEYDKETPYLIQENHFGDILDWCVSEDKIKIVP